MKHDGKMALPFVRKLKGGEIVYKEKQLSHLTKHLKNLSHLLKLNVSKVINYEKWNSNFATSRVRSFTQSLSKTRLPQNVRGVVVYGHEVC